jgi:hypothetical protein
MISVILATDMACHFEWVNKFSTQLETKGSKVEEPGERRLLMNIIVHCADISNVAKPYVISRKWSDRVFEEFLLQVLIDCCPFNLANCTCVKGDAERDSGLSISPYMDRNNTNQAKMTISFIGMCRLLTKFSLNNFKYWQITWSCHCLHVCTSFRMKRSNSWIILEQIGKFSSLKFV